MNRRLILSVFLVGILMLTSTIRADDILSTLRKGHPRLLALDNDLADARSAAIKHPVAKLYYDGLLDAAHKILDQPPVEHKLIGIRLLAQSRAALSRIEVLGAIYRLEGDKKYAERARKELLTIVAMPDWNPRHFLDTAEMTNAAALGYDWFYDYLSPEDRATIKRGIIDLGLKPGLEAYEKTKPSWTKADHNWAQVCAGGMLMGALAIADEEPDLAREMIPLTREAIVRAMKTFAPDGGWPEGPGYWDYATQYNVYYLAALDTALGTDLGLKSMPGFADTGNFRIQAVGPIGKSFNFADAGEGVGQASQMYWFARHFDHPEYAAAERYMFPRFNDAFGLLWFAGRGSMDKLPLDAFFRKINVVFFRSAFEDPNAWYVGFKGGSNHVNHSHEDIGTFVLDALGQRWASDLGPDNYDIPGYFTKDQRFTYYRLGTQGHNTITFDNANQSLSADAPIVAYQSTPERAYAVADLASAYPGATKAHRGIALIKRNSVLVQDEFAGEKELPVVWAMHTPASVKISEAGNVATLTKGDVSIEVRLLEPKGAKFETMVPKVDPPQTPLKGITKLFVRPIPAKEIRIAVLFSAKDAANDMTVEPLQKWIDAAPTTQP